MGKIVLIRKELILFFVGKWDGSLFQILRDITWKILSKNKKDKELKIIS